ncbi:PEP/pyruvate-binding domain-containing protein [Portibacter marinus]|uniref:PEP/pyruvate-binding domain-containing protein n=1 Tax=Portibacter marinus TaxID=2898660 RepID=UPI001F44FAA6|nr:PEP/pyruvate-binding domain-containing protein [Portibacter marinus]
MKDYLLLSGQKIGGKATQLIRLSEEGFNVPHFKVIPAEFQHELHEIEKSLGQWSEENKFYSVRSSAVGEDGSDYSFAGLFETFLFVRRGNLLEMIQKVYQSSSSERVTFYKQQNNIEGEVQMAVIIQEMVFAETSGVMFGLHPITLKEGDMLISSVYGVGEGLVSGTLNSDDFTIRNGMVFSQVIAIKDQKMVYDQKGGGTILQKVKEDMATQSSLKESQISLLVNELEKINALYKSPQDVEWAFDQKGELFILQSRPITNIHKQKGSRIIWDNSNIIESYPGVTTPLTFSFIREMYRVVYEQFSAFLGIDKDVLEAHADVYENMLGLLRGRVYYNLRSWYRALALLPGYRLNVGFMETMMGVKERFELEDQYKVSKSKARWMTVKTIWKAILTFRKLPRERDAFLNFLDVTVKKYQEIDFKSETPEELKKHYDTFEKILTERWNPPLVNDFFAMIYFGIFQKLIEKWIGKDHPHLHNDLLAASNDIISTQPMIQSLRLAQEILDSHELRDRFKGDPKAVYEIIEGYEIKSKIDKYLKKFGERCLGELKLETISYNQAPHKFIKILQSYINNPESLETLKETKSATLKTEAQKIVHQHLKGRFFRNKIFNYFLKKTRELVSNRENLRFERTRGFGIVRQIFSAIGLQFEKRGLIDHHRDVFYLTKEEIFDFIQGTAVSVELRAIIKLRKKEYAEYEKDSYVPERITTYGTVNEGLEFTNMDRLLEATDGDLKGIACCPGVVKSEICVVHSPDQIDDLNGRIMVTTSTDPGWITLFPTASGILVERGSLLSHSAIVARELGIPCIVAINGLLESLKTGDLVEMDGGSGVVKLLNHDTEE